MATTGDAQQAHPVSPLASPAEPPPTEYQSQVEFLGQNKKYVVVRGGVAELKTLIPDFDKRVQFSVRHDGYIMRLSTYKKVYEMVEKQLSYQSEHTATNDERTAVNPPSVAGTVKSAPAPPRSLDLSTDPPSSDEEAEIPSPKHKESTPATLTDAAPPLDMLQALPAHASSVRHGALQPRKSVASHKRPAEDKQDAWTREHRSRRNDDSDSGDGITTVVSSDLLALQQQVLALSQDVRSIKSAVLQGPPSWAGGSDNPQSRAPHGSDGAHFNMAPMAYGGRSQQFHPSTAAPQHAQTPYAHSLTGATPADVLTVRRENVGAGGAAGMSWPGLDWLPPQQLQQPPPETGSAAFGGPGALGGAQQPQVVPGSRSHQGLPGGAYEWPMR